MTLDFSTEHNFGNTLDKIAQVHDMDFTLVGADGKTPLSDSFFHNVYNAFHILDDDIVDKVKNAALKAPSKMVSDFEKKISRGYEATEYDVASLYDHLTGKLLVGVGGNRLEDPWDGILPHDISMKAKIDAANKVVMITGLDFDTTLPYYNGVPAFSADNKEEPMSMELTHVNSQIVSALSLIDAEIKYGEEGFQMEEVYTIKMVTFYPGDTTPTVLDASFYDEFEMIQTLSSIEESVNKNNIIRIVDAATDTTLMVQPNTLHSIGTYKAIKLVDLNGFWFDSYRVM